MAPNSSLKLLDLPPEVRNKIYDLVLPSSDTLSNINNNDSDSEPSTDSSLVCPFILACSPGKRKYGYSLTQTCRQIRAETLAMWHARSNLLFVLRAVNVQYYIAWLRRRPEGAFAALRRFRIEDYQHARTTGAQAHPGFCRAAIVVNLNKAVRPVMWRRDPGCWWCGAGRDEAVERVRKVVGSLEWSDGEERWVMTGKKLEEVFEAAAWVV